MRILIRICIVIGLLCTVYSCKKYPKRFIQLSGSRTGIDFNNEIIETDSLNVLQYMNIYTGAGVAVGDVNNDGLTDVYLSGNSVSGKLYLNLGDFKFKDITESAGLINKSWGTGVSMVDINQDGYLDIYICVSGLGVDSKKANLLYINEGPSTNGNIHFSEQAEEYGLADTRQSMHAAFFDYDKDNDLDMYLLINPAAYEHKVNTSFPRKINGESINNDRLYRNEGIQDELGHPVFTDVSMEAGIKIEGYGLGVGVSDINNDNWPDLYISNDFIGNDILYINQKDGTFKDEIESYVNHTSYAGMGNDISDIDNNGKPDIIVLDMRPEDNRRQKLIISSTGYDRFQMMIDAGYNHQYSRNTLQLNLGEGKFSEISNLAGVSSTDWSWSPLFADFDNDGFKDLYVTNGFLRDLGDLDYINYQGIYDNPLGDKQSKIRLKLNSIKALPSAAISNYAFRNTGKLSFEKVSRDWGIEIQSCSSGSAFVDLNNDGYLDLVVNNMNQPSFVFKNNPLASEGLKNFIRIKLNGDQGNKHAIGAKLELTTASGPQFYQHFLSRGYESSVDPVIHFGVGSDSIIEQLKITWPDDSIQYLRGIKPNQLIEINKEPKIVDKVLTPELSQPWFTEVTNKLTIKYAHVEDLYVDFKSQPILPHMSSRNGPGVSVADVNGDELEDFYIGGAFKSHGGLYLQQLDGSFKQSDFKSNLLSEDMGSLFFDADSDGDLDLYIVSGGSQNSLKENYYQDHLYVNDGHGNFEEYGSLPLITSSGSVVTASDYDKDGDLDLFVGGRVRPGEYPISPESYLMENITLDQDKPRFKNVGYETPNWNKLGMVTSALWTDYDNDGWIDLMVVGEFMPITLFHNENGKLKYVHNPVGLKNTSGWWNSITGSDFDSDGDIDYIVGNLGLNNKYHVSKSKPLRIHAKDYELDGRIDPLMSYYNGDDNYLAHSRDEIISQINVMKSRFRNYESYATVNFEEAFLPSELADAYVVEAQNFSSSYVENLGDGSFKVNPLPIEAQFAPVKGIVVADFNHDNFEDILLTGNSYQTNVSTGRYDASKGLVLKGDGRGNFKPLTLKQSGFINDFDATGLSLLRDKDNDLKILVANNNNLLKVFSLNQLQEQSLKILPTDISGEIIYENNSKTHKEFYFGSGYLSQSSRSIEISNGIKQIYITNNKGVKRLAFGASN